MEKLISIKHVSLQHVPESYILPPERRPGDQAVLPFGNDIPVVDLGQNINTNRHELVQNILKASQDFGFFQLINHGISEELMNDSLEVATEFFQLPVEDKALLYSEDPKQQCRLYTSIDYEKEKVHFWRDGLRHPCHPLQDHIQDWPIIPTRYREVMGEFSIQAREVSLLLLDLIREGLGLELGYFEGELSKIQTMTLNHYPPCPDPSLTLGLPKHSDVNLITLLNQGQEAGLQVLLAEKWLAVKPLPGVFVVNIGHALQIISNGKLKSADHRVVTNKSRARTTVASFIHPSGDCHIRPAEKFIADDAILVPNYTYFRYNEFVATYITDTQEGNPPLKRYGIT